MNSPGVEDAECVGRRLDWEPRGAESAALERVEEEVEKRALAGLLYCVHHPAGKMSDTMRCKHHVRERQQRQDGKMWQRQRQTWRRGGGGGNSVTHWGGGS
jgi:hypothetical protein